MQKTVQKLGFRFSLLMIAGLVLACAGTSAGIPGETQAAPALQVEIVRAIGNHEASAPGGRKKPEIIDTKILGADGKSRREIWTVLRRDEKIHYEVTLSPSAPPDKRIVVRRIRARAHDGN